MEILVVSAHAPYDGIGKAGEKTHNYYLKQLKTHGNNVYTICFCNKTDENKLDFEKYGIENAVFVESNNKCIQMINKIKRLVHIAVFPNDKYANFVPHYKVKYIRAQIERYIASGKRPDCIILEWTHMILLVDIIRKYFPSVPIVASSHDVNYVGSRRYWEQENNFFVKYFRKKQHLNLKKREIVALSKCDVIVSQNENDINILKANDLLKNKKYYRIVPYYDNYGSIRRNPKENIIIFYGAMDRSENYKSVQWFIENVFSKLKDYQFIIMGGNPTQDIKRYVSPNIKVTGFLPIEEVQHYFSICKCMVVPLRLGSGIKVKILEAFSAGIPVLTNEIGIEGILADAGREYFHCETPDEYLSVLNDLQTAKIDSEKIGENAKQFVKVKHNLEESALNYMQMLNTICNQSKKVI